VCFRVFLCDARSCDWDIDRNLLRKNFYRLPFTPPSLVANPVFQLRDVVTGRIARASAPGGELSSDETARPDARLRRNRAGATGWRVVATHGAVEVEPLRQGDE
jgi:hypothetical protein